MKKTFLLFFMAFACLVASYGQMLFNYTDALGTTWKFSLETDGAYIIDATQGSNHFSGVLNIPGTVEKDGQSYPVAGIGYKNNAISSSNSFFNNNDITGITFPPSLTSIGSYVMFGCKGLTHVTIPSTVKKIGIRAFGSCTALTSLNIEDGVETIGNSAFQGCTSLHGDLTIFPSVKSFGIYAFQGCPLDGTLTVLAQSTIDKPSIFETSYNDIYDYSWGFGSFKHIVFGGPAPTPLYAYNNKPRHSVLNQTATIVSITFLPEVKKIAPYTLMGGYTLRLLSNTSTLTIPEGVEEIGERAFAFSGLSIPVSIPTTVKKVERGIFEHTNISKLTIPQGHLTEVPASIAKDCPNLTQVSIPSNITSLGSSCFSGCTALPNVQLPAGLKVIGDSAFLSCRTFVSVSIPNTVTKIGDKAFYECENLTDVLPFSTNIKYIGDEAFRGCLKLTADAATLFPSSLDTLGSAVFVNCRGITGEAVLPSPYHDVYHKLMQGEYRFVTNPVVGTGCYGIKMGPFANFFQPTKTFNQLGDWKGYDYQTLLYIDARECTVALTNGKNLPNTCYKFSRTPDLSEEDFIYCNFSNLAMNALVYLPSESAFQDASLPQKSFAERFEFDHEYPADVYESNGENFIMGDKCQRFYVQDGLDYRVPIAFTAIEARCSRIFSNTAGLAVSTLYLPYPTDLPDGMKAYSLSFKGLDINGDKAFHFAPVPAGTRLEANHPYLIQITDGQSHRLPTMHNVEVPVSPNMEASAVMATSDADWKFYGTTERLDNAKAYDKKAYYLSGNKWWAIENGVENNFIASFRCFITSPTGAVPAKSFIMVLEDNTATSVNKLEKDTESDIQSGRYEFYSVDGLRMGKDYDKLQSGQIYIVNGKKFYKL
ncbi:MAG: leucine-rich repeat domain-containing protein [Prevotellaceae bacterium]|nr:leucine-rich repeat domain-containing protein [Prevotellaceae bacterium]